MATINDLFNNLKTLLDKIYVRKQSSSYNASAIVTTDANKNITTTASIPATSVTGLSTVATSGSYNNLSNKPTIPNASTSAPLMDIVNGAVGTGTTWAKADHQHPLSTAYATADHTHNYTNISIADNLTTNDATQALSAKQGKILKDQTYKAYVAVTDNASSDEYKVTIDGVTHTHGVLIVVLNNRSTANNAGCSLNVNSLGAKPIYYHNRAIKKGEFPYRSASFFMYSTWNAFNSGSGAWIMLDDHPKLYDTAKSSGLYKISVDTDGHVSATTNVTANDLPSHSHSASAISISGLDNINNIEDAVNDLYANVTSPSHTHGDITTDGAITTSTVNFANGDVPIVADASASGKLQKGYVPAGYIKDETSANYSGIGLNANNKTQKEINTAIDNKFKAISYNNGRLTM